MRPVTKYAKGVVRQEEILAAAAEVIAREGYDAATVRHLAETIGLSKTGLVHHFGSKEALLIALLERRDLPAQPPEELPVTEVVDAVLGEIDRSLKAPGLIELYIRFCAEASAPDHPAHEHFVERYRRMDRDTESTLERLAGGGVLAPGARPSLLAVLFIAVLDGLQMRRLFTPDLDVGAHLAHLFAMLGPDLPEDPARESAVRDRWHHEHP